VALRCVNVLFTTADKPCEQSTDYAVPVQRITLVRGVFSCIDQVASNDMVPEWERIWKETVLVH
jgi:hypothetical protein